MSDFVRPEGDDVVIQVRVRRANLAALRDGVTLGVDEVAGGEIRLSLEEQADGTYAIQAQASARAMMATTPEPVGVERA